MNEETTVHDGDWPLRPWLLATMLGLGGLAVWLASGGFKNDPEPWRAALMALAFFGTITAGLTLERGAWLRAAVFSALVGVVMAGIAWRVARDAGHYDAAGFWLASGIVSTLLAVPLFQAGFHRLRWKTSYFETHYHVWTDAITGGGALAFTGLAWLVAALLSELFHLIKIDLLRDLLDEGWFGWTFSGVAFGAALGTLRNQVRIIGTLQNVVLLVLSLLAVPVAVGVVLFLLAVSLSGLDVLWEATRNATPVLLAIATGSFVLVNAVLRDSDEAASGSRIMRAAAFVLALGILPLAIMAAISMGTRIAEYGLSPERIWALVAIMVAVAYGVAYLVAAIRSRRHGWDTQRQANLHLAVATCVLAFLLAMPILDFGAISTSNQVGRLAAGKVKVEDFDFDALRWDFGESGRKALARLANSDDAETARLAKEAQDRESRPYRWRNNDSEKREARLANLRTDIPEGSLRDALEAKLRENIWMCDDPCVAIDIGPAKEGGRHVVLVESGQVIHQVLDAPPTPDDTPKSGAVEAAMETGVIDPVPPQSADSTVEVREWTGRRIYVDGKPAGEPFE
ncbi:MAG: DUF4153 domain-containing protein [Erythrobacter sp.]